LSALKIGSQPFSIALAAPQKTPKSTEIAALKSLKQDRRLALATPSGSFSLISGQNNTVQNDEDQTRSLSNKSAKTRNRRYQTASSSQATSSLRKRKTSMSQSQESFNADSSQPSRKGNKVKRSKSRSQQSPSVAVRHSSRV
jgi:hypothetical protein